MKRIFVIFFSLFAIAVSAGTLTINGNDCGNVKLVTLSSPEGNVVLTTDGTCGNVVQPPPVVTPPPTSQPTVQCPAGVRCLDRPWPTIPRELLTIRQGEGYAFKVKTTDAVGKFGRVIATYTSGDSAILDVALATVPGEFPAKCTASGLEAIPLPWQQGGTSTWKCVLAPSTTYWINIRASYCEAGKTCRFYLTGG